MPVKGEERRSMTGKEFDFDVAIVGAGPAGAVAARILAEQGVKVGMLERRTQVGIPVRCAEFVPAFLYRLCDLPPAAIAQRISQMETVLPDGRITRTSAPGFVLHRALFDNHLVARAVGAGAVLMLKSLVLDVQGHEVTLKRAGKVCKVSAQVIIGADGPYSVVREKMGLATPVLAHAFQMEIVLKEAQPHTKVFFHPDFFGGYGWLFPKGQTGNAGFGMVVREKGDMRQGRQRLMDLLGIDEGRILGFTGGSIPVGGLFKRIVQDNQLLIGDAAGVTHPITGAGIANAVISGTLVARTIPGVLHSGNWAGLADYEDALRDHLGNSLALALRNRNFQEQNWHRDEAVLTQVVKQTWVAYQDYGKRGKGELFNG